jgi:hypothetical protein
MPPHFLYFNLKYHLSIVIIASLFIYRIVFIYTTRKSHIFVNDYSQTEILIPFNRSHPFKIKPPFVPQVGEVKSHILKIPNFGNTVV